MRGLAILVLAIAAVALLALFAALRAGGPPDALGTDALLSSTPTPTPVPTPPVEPTMTPTPTPTNIPTPVEPTITPPSACQVQWPSVTVNTTAKGQNATNNAKVEHAITGHIVEPGTLGPTASRIRVCDGTAVSINVTDSTGTPTLNSLTPNIACTFVAGTTPDCTVASLTVTAKYQALSNDGKDNDRVTLLPGSGYGD